MLRGARRVAVLVQRNVRAVAAPALHAGLGLLGAAHLFVRTSPYGAALTSDSVSYITAADSLAAGRGLPATFQYWPPFFPLLLAFLRLGGIDPAAAGRYLNILAFGLVLGVAGFWLQRNLKSSLIALATTATAAVSFPLNHAFSYVLTESLFILCLVLALLQIEAWRKQPGPAALRPLLVAAAIAGAATVTRYAGVTLIAAINAVILGRRTSSLRSRLRGAAVFNAVALLPLMAVLGRNWVVMGTLTGPRDLVTESKMQPLSASLDQLFHVLQQWTFTTEVPEGQLLLILLGAAAAMAGALVYGIARDRATMLSAFGQRALLPFGLFALIYVAFFVGVAPWGFEQILDTRYLVPVYLPLMLTGASLLDECRHRATQRRSRIVQGVLTAVTLAAFVPYLSLSVRDNLALTVRARTSGYIDDTYNTKRWTESATMAFVKAHGINGRLGFIYSNDDSGVYWVTGRDFDPDRYHWIPNGPQRLRQWFEGKTDVVHVIWLDFAPKRGYERLEVQALPGVETLAELDDGAVFRVPRGATIDEAVYQANKARYVRRLMDELGLLAVRARFNVYVNRAHRRLTYVKTPCRPEDVQSKFILHIVPVEPADLPERRQPFGFENLGAYFHDDGFGRRFDDTCMAAMALPAYRIARIRVGQYDSRAQRDVWKEEFPWSALSDVDSASRAADSNGSRQSVP